MKAFLAAALLLFFHIPQELRAQGRGKGQQSKQASNQASEARYLLINGIEQWVTINGDSTKPIVLFLHGGPGSPLSPYAQAIYGHWQKDYLLVQWDQRGAGRTYGRNAPEELSPEYLQSHPLTLDQMSADGIELTKYLLNRFGRQKLILFGTSWGSVLGVSMVQKNPELFYAYIGHSQIVYARANEIASFRKMQQLVKEYNDEEGTRLLEMLNKPPPYDTARNTGRFLRLVRKYEEKISTPAPASWFVLPPEYDNEKDNQHRSDGDDYSFVNYNGDKSLGVAPIRKTVNFLTDALVFEIPVYIIQGENDIQTQAILTKSWVEKIKAPAKEMILLPGAGHGLNQAVIDAHFNIMKKYIRP